MEERMKEKNNKEISQNGEADCLRGFRIIKQNEERDKKESRGK